jgi:hypothetical protein
MIQATINLGQKDVAAMERAMEAASRRLGKDMEQVQGQMAWYIAQSLGASTRTSPKMRKVEENPDPRAGKDNRVALFGVYKYKSDGSKKFVPIRGTGEYGKVRFVSRTTGEMLSRINGEVHRTRFNLHEAGMSNVNDSPHRKIKRSGMAKRSWTKMRGIAARGGYVTEPGVGAVSSVTAKRGLRPSITITNRLRYVEDAMTGGKRTTDTVIQRATDAMIGAIDSRVADLEKHWGK